MILFVNGSYQKGKQLKSLELVLLVVVALILLVDMTRMQVHFLLKQTGTDWGETSNGSYMIFALKTC